MSDYIIVNDIIEYDENVKAGDESSESDVKKKPVKRGPVKKNKFKEDYFVFYDDIKLTPKDDW